MGVSFLILNGKLFKAPEIIVDFVKNFDEGEPVKPFVYTFSVEPNE